jgi:drug/metabolite transporter (DMT)-like permease
VAVQERDARLAFERRELLPLAPGLPGAIGSAPSEALLAVGFLDVGASAIGFVTWAYACASVDVSVAAATLYAVPVVAFSAGWLWLGEKPAPMALAGGAIALAGVAVVTRAITAPPAAARTRAASAAPSLPASPAGAAHRA